MQALNYLDLDTPTGNKRVTTRHDIEKALLIYHKSHFTQAQDTPLAAKYIIERIILATDTKHSEKLR